MTSSLRHVYSVSELADAIKDRLQTAFPDTQVRGEISGLARPASGHIYFTLKDDNAAIRCILYRHMQRYLRVELEAGKEYLLRGKVSAYGPRSEYQIVVDYAEPLGMGALYAAFVELQQKLAAKGYFDSERKRPLPAVPQTVGIVTSLAGAALRDMLKIILARQPGQHVVISPTLVQGTTAAASLAVAIERLANFADPDVIIVGRGGGSLEDLWCWNDETVVRAVADCPVPIVSGVGHEVDVSLCDLAADVRAATPTHAAELVVPDVRELRAKIADFRRRASRQLATHHQQLRRQLEHVGYRLRTEAVPTVAVGRELDELLIRLRRAAHDTTTQTDQRLALLAHRLQAAAPRNRLDQQRRRLTDVVGRMRRALTTTLQSQQTTCFHRQEHVAALRHRLERAIAKRWDAERLTLAATAGRLRATSPLAVLERGYAIVTGPDGRVLREASSTHAGGEIAVRLHQGRLSAQVTKTHE